MPRYPIIEDTVREFRIWDPLAPNDEGGLGKNVPHRCYSDATRAENAAWVLLRWLKIGRVFEVINVRTGKLLRQYVRRVHDVAIFEPHHAIRNADQLQRFINLPQLTLDKDPGNARVH